jgi:hypothetical protein
LNLFIPLFLINFVEIGWFRTLSNSLSLKLYCLRCKSCRYFFGNICNSIIFQNSYVSSKYTCQKVVKLSINWKRLSCTVEVCAKFQARNNLCICEGVYSGIYRDWISPFAVKTSQSIRLCRQTFPELKWYSNFGH